MKLSVTLALWTALAAASEQSYFALKQHRRPLVHGEYEFLQTTDTHGWFEQTTDTYFGDWGDLANFHHHMKTQNPNLIFIDSGDKHDGNGVSDASTPRGHYSRRLFRDMPYDAVTVGNHELYNAEVATLEYEEVSLHLGDRYLSGNVDIWRGQWKPFGERFRVIERSHYPDGRTRRILTFGFLYDFDLHPSNIRVTKVQEAVKQQWFLDALNNEEYDVVAVVGHIPLRSWEFPQLIEAIRQQTEKPLVLLGGHSHVRDAVKLSGEYDGPSEVFGIQGGRFLETLGWLSLNVSTSEGPQSTSSRAYIDFNVHGLQEHAGNPEEWNTALGKRLRRQLNRIKKKLDLKEVYGCVPQNFYTNGAKFPSHSSLLSLIAEDVLPTLNGTAPGAAGGDRVIITNTGGLRFDLLKGPYTRNTGFVVSPFPNNWVYLPNVDLHTAHDILPYLNRKAHILGSGHMAPEEIPQDCDQFYTTAHKGLLPGYVTLDDFGHDGDDTPHWALPYYELPNAIQTEMPADGEAQYVDVIFYDFIAPFIQEALYALDRPDYFERLTDYGGKGLNELLRDYADKHWSC